MLRIAVNQSLRCSRGSLVLRRAFRAPPSGKENAALLRELETALKDPDALQRLSALLAPSTTRNLSHALSSVRKAQRFSPAAATAGAQQELEASSSASASATAAAAATGPVTVSAQDLKYVALQFGLPFVGFGFVDNAIMILAGDYIDLTLGVSLGISSMAAAGIGNTISDIAGLGLGNVVEDMCARLGLPNPSLTQEQVRFSLDAIDMTAVSLLTRSIDACVSRLYVLFV